MTSAPRSPDRVEVHGQVPDPDGDEDQPAGDLDDAVMAGHEPDDLLTASAGEEREQDERQPEAQPEREEGQDPRSKLLDPDGEGDERQRERSGTGQRERPEHHPVQVGLAVGVRDDWHGGAGEPLERVAAGEQRQAQGDEEQVDGRDDHPEQRPEWR
jgi:hypothetical protein